VTDTIAPSCDACGSTALYNIYVAVGVKGRHIRGVTYRCNRCGATTEVAIPHRRYAVLITVSDAREQHTQRVEYASQASTPAAVAQEIISELLPAAAGETVRAGTEDREAGSARAPGRLIGP